MDMNTRLLHSAILTCDDLLAWDDMMSCGEIKTMTCSDSMTCVIPLVHFNVGKQAVFAVLRSNCLASAIR